MATQGEKKIEITEREMASTDVRPNIWNQIERSESYLVCCMYEEASELASSVLKQIRDDKLSIKIGDDFELLDMMEAAGMVLVQSLKELGRTRDVMIELTQLFGSATTIPVRVLLIGACMQISQGFSSACQQVLEEFLSKWSCIDEQHYVLIGQEANVTHMENCDVHSMLKVDEYLEVVEIYVVNILGMVLKDINLATSWVEKAAIPEGRRQELLRRLHSMCSRKSTSSSQGSPLPTDGNLKKSNLYVGSAEALKAKHGLIGEGVKNQAALKLSGQVKSYFWWFNTITLKFGRFQFVITNGKILLGCLTVLIYYIWRRKQKSLKRIVRNQALSVKKGFIDLWKLAFSYQVNPLAAVQPLGAATNGIR